MRHAAAAVAAMMALAAGGCATPTVGYEVAVRDAASGEPVEGARVIAQTLHHYHPMAYGDIATFSWRGSFAEGETDERGVAFIEASDTRPIRFLVWADGRGVQSWFFDPPPESAEWAVAADAEEAPLEMRLRAVGR